MHKNIRKDRFEARKKSEESVLAEFEAGLNGQPDSEEADPVRVRDPLPDSFLVFYEPRSKTYWLPTRSSRGYTNVSRRDIPYHLMYCLYERKDDVDKRIVQIQLQHSLSYVGSLPSWSERTGQS